MSQKAGAMKTEAGKWLAESDGRKPRVAHWKEPKTHSKNPITWYSHQLKVHSMSPREYVESVRHQKSADCMFVPRALKGRPSTVTFLGRTISAARYMALLTYGTPRNEGAVVRHMCGNGHLSCVNPAHLEWGSEQNNRQDAGKHRGLDSAQDKIHATAGKR